MISSLLGPSLRNGSDNSLTNDGHQHGNVPRPARLCKSPPILPIILGKLITLQNILEMLSHQHEKITFVCIFPICKITHISSYAEAANSMCISAMHPVRKNNLNKILVITWTPKKNQLLLPSFYSYVIIPFIINWKLTAP